MLKMLLSSNLRIKVNDFCHIYYSSSVEPVKPGFIKIFSMRCCNVVKSLTLRTGSQANH